MVPSRNSRADFSGGWRSFLSVRLYVPAVMAAGSMLTHLRLPSLAALPLSQISMDVGILACAAAVAMACSRFNNDRLWKCDGTKSMAMGWCRSVVVVAASLLLGYRSVVAVMRGWCDDRSLQQAVFRRWCLMLSEVSLAVSNTNVCVGVRLWWCVRCVCV